MRVGFHLGNSESGVSDADWRVLKACPPGCITFLPGHGADPDTIRRILDIAPDCHCIMRPYYVPSRSEAEYLGVELNKYSDECLEFCDAYGVIPEGQRHIQVFNEQNQPRWAQWEGFGDQLADMRTFDDAFCHVATRLKAAAPGWKVGFTPLTPGNRDAWFQGDPDGHYYMHDQGEAMPGPCGEALCIADEYYAHVYLDAKDDVHPLTAAGLPWLGQRHRTYAEFFPRPYDIWIPEAGLLHPDNVDAATLIQWFDLLDQQLDVAGVCLWMLGSTPWGQFWHRNGRPIPEVYALAEWARGHPHGVSPPPPSPELALPIAGARVSQEFGVDGHRGLDLTAPDGVRHMDWHGIAVHATEPGIARVVRPDKGYGLYSYTFGDTCDELLAHLADVAVADGTRVAPGTVVGYAGYSGNCRPPGVLGCHLHWGKRPKPYAMGNGHRGYVDPMKRARGIL